MPTGADDPGEGNPPIGCLGDCTPLPAPSHLRSLTALRLAADDVIISGSTGLVAHKSNAECFGAGTGLCLLDASDGSYASGCDATCLQA